jgi:hypothetical protein
MQFRWVAFIALWCTLIGPILAAPPRPPELRAQLPAGITSPVASPQTR